ncbi:IclR family transcriptional regulator [Streptomyces sp. NBC_01474]|uniref:IclR family transcriptional regulator n=1 Tax=Streptomyces TaxID=1883 RepID=UPI002DD7D4EE|nr:MULTISPECIES: IclR family transcriptional regulator [unclassified Streptomyces]WSD93585.1 IclR family transcriptional regulator [Streptomyces sp. NBC_01474]
MGETSSFERGLAVLRDLAVTGETTVAATAARVGLPVSTTYRYFRVLREQGYTEEDDGVYRAGPALAGLWGASSVQAHLIETGTAVLRRIVERVGETAVLIIRVGTQALCLRRVEPDKALKYTFGINELLPLYAGAGQRVLLASAPSAVVRQVLGGPLARYTDATPAREQLDAVLPAVRRNGWAVSRGELHPGSLSVAVPVFHHGEAVCSLDVAGPAARCDTREWITSAHETLLTSAAELGDSLHTWAPKAPTAPAPHPDSPDRRRPDEVTTHDS